MSEPVVKIADEIEWYCEGCNYVDELFRPVCPSCGTINGYDSRPRRPAKEFRRPFLLPRQFPQANPENDGNPQEEGESQEQDVDTPRIMTLDDVEDMDVTRLPTGIPEADEVFGSATEFGPAVGSCILLGGDRGIGKSTFVAQTIYNYAGRNINTLYGSAEESELAVRARVIRVGGASSKLLRRISIVRTDNIHALYAAWNVGKPPVVVVDSIQAFKDPELNTHSKVVQMDATAKSLQQFSADTQTLVICISHLTKDGDLAGPEAAQHWVDGCFLFGRMGNGVIQLSCDGKNRFGLASRVAYFKMDNKGKLLPYYEDQE